MVELTWKEAIVKVFEDEKKALHYANIAELIAERGYKTTLGAKPKNTVNTQMASDINDSGEKSIFSRVGGGIYILRKFLGDSSLLATEEDEIEIVPNQNQKSEKEHYKIINAFGIYWDRNLVHWKTTPDLLGIQQIGASVVNFKDQIGIYLLHDSRETIYVGQAIKQPLGKRLKDHTTDRHGGRWDRFSWFGFYPIDEKGELLTNIKLDNITIQSLGDVLEAILIESIEPRQNRKQGNFFSGLEYLQQEAPELKKQLKAGLLIDLLGKL
ncbi:hypothetical protein Barb4_03878 [Bacteroidales bacterium Barb4]|nr:hypothetical protein Barb4_03878 [Bacteroidales bacterium Barb4]